MVQIFNANNTTATGNVVQDGTAWKLTPTHTEVAGNGSISFDSGIATITSPSSQQSLTGNPGTMLNTPYVLTQDVSGDFDAYVDMDNQAGSFSGFGLRIDNTNYVMVYRFYNPSTMEFNTRIGSWISGTRGLGTASVTIQSQSIQVRLTRSGNSFTGYYRANSGDAWTSLGSLTAAVSSDGSYFAAADYHTAQVSATFDLNNVYTAPVAEITAVGDAESGFAFDFSTALEDTTGAPVTTYQYTTDAGATTYNGTDLSLAQLQAVSDTNNQLTNFKIGLTGNGGEYYNYFSIDVYAKDLTPPTDVSATANSALSGEGETFDLIATFTGGTEIGTSGYAGANLEIEIDGVSYFQQSDGSFLADETFENLLLKGNEGERSIAYALGELAIPDRFRINAWDLAMNYNRGDWATFAEADLDNIIVSAGGNYDDTNLIPENVKIDITYGVDEVGTYDPTGVVINTPTLSVVNNEDGTATATVSGSSTGTTNTIYLAKYGTSSWVADGSRSEDGDITLTLDNGSYWGYIKSNFGTSCAYSIVAIFRVTDGEDAEIVNLAEQVKDLIDGSSIAGTGAEISRNYIQHERLENIQNTEIWVQPNEHRIETLSRAKDDHEFDIDISVLKRCKTTAETDSLILLSEQIYEFLRRVNVEEYTITTVSLPTLFSPDELVERNLFAAVLTVTFKGVK